MSKTKQPQTKKEQSTPQVSPTVLTPERLETIIEFLGEEDLALIFDIRLLSPNGEIFQVKGNSSFSQAMRPSNKGAVPTQFEDVTVNSLLSPLLQRFNDHIQDNVENVLALPKEVNPMTLEDNTVPSSPLDKNGTTEENVTADSPPDQGTIP